MAPEVGLHQPYNETCDVYSFAILFWELLALKQPYKKLHDTKSMCAQVWSNGSDGERPPVDKEWSVSIKILLKRAWSSNLQDRPRMGSIVSILRDECIKQEIISKCYCCRRDDEKKDECTTTTKPVEQQKTQRRSTTFVFDLSHLKGM
jgi:serine/threonine protein kinase